MNLFSVLSISASGMAAQRTRAEILTENLANAETTRTPEGTAYRRKSVVFETAPVRGAFAAELGDAMAEQSRGVAVTKILEDAEFDRRYMPQHPDADADGYIELPRVNPAEEMVDLLDAARQYEANVSAMAAVKDMIHRSLDILR